MEKRLQAHWHGQRLHVWADTRAGEGIARGEVRAMLGDLSADALLGSVGVDGELTVAVGGGGDAGARVLATLAFEPADAVDLLMLLGNGCAAGAPFGCEPA